MPHFLLFQLYGPLVAWGDIAVGERRPARPHPSRSGVLGLVAAALGVERTDSAGLRALHEGYGLACRVDSAGALLVDYHTAQVAPSPAVKGSRLGRFLSRKDELAIGPDAVKTILSQRDYYQDVLSVACLWALPGAPHPLERLASALREPVFTPYLGRRSCPPALPFHPRVVEAAGPIEALRATAVDAGGLLTGLRRSARRTYLWEGGEESLTPQQTRVRRDVALDRRQWQFAERLEHLAVEEEGSDVPESD
jgi:CRISPR system Cascade subunit CasD